MSTEIFKRKAPWVMSLLMQDFPIGLEDAAAIVGNLGHESNGLQAINEVNPTVPGSRGGYGWPQWTGPRRRDFEAYCARNGLNMASDVAQYKYLFVELTTTEKRAIPAVVAANGLRNKVEAFEQAFERAGVKHYESREKWAERALEAYANSSAKDRIAPWAEEAKPAPAPVPAPVPPVSSYPQGNQQSAPKPAPDPSIVGGPVEKAIGAGKGSAAGSIVAGGVPAAIIFIMEAYGAIPEGLDSAAFGVALGVILTGFGSFVMAVMGAYKSKKNSE